MSGRRRVRGLGTAAAVGGGLLIGALGLVIPAANAATYQYANDTPAYVNQTVDSGVLSSILSSQATVQLGVGTVYTQNDRSNPGWQNLGYGSSLSPGPAYADTSQREYSARAQCWWYVRTLPQGTADLTCSANY